MGPFTQWQGIDEIIGKEIFSLYSVFAIFNVIFYNIMYCQEKYTEKIISISLSSPLYVYVQTNICFVWTVILLKNW